MSSEENDDYPLREKPEFQLYFLEKRYQHCLDSRKTASRYFVLTVLTWLASWLIITGQVSEVNFGIVVVSNPTSFLQFSCIALGIFALTASASMFHFMASYGKLLLIVYTFEQSLKDTVHALPYLPPIPSGTERGSSSSRLAFMAKSRIPSSAYGPLFSVFTMIFGLTPLVMWYHIMIVGEPFTPIIQGAMILTYIILNTFVVWVLLDPKTLEQLLGYSVSTDEEDS